VVLGDNQYVKIPSVTVRQFIVGALVVAVGRVAGNVNVGGNTNIAGNMGASGDANVDGGMNVAGNAYISGNVMLTTTSSLVQQVKINDGVRKHNSGAVVSVGRVWLETLILAEIRV
jgi:hypothetical protein